jgi:hypothetical protein
MAIFNIGRFPISRTYNLPGTSRRKFELARTTFQGIRPNSAASKDNVIGVYTLGLRQRELINSRCQAWCSDTNSIAILQQMARRLERLQE